MRKAITKEEMALLKEADEMFNETGCVPGNDGEQVPYCCEACGKRARRKPNGIKNHICAACKGEFRSTRRDARFCTNACRQSDYRL